MPWCPKCKNEYVEGIIVCADCGTELVASLVDEDVNEILKVTEEETARAGNACIEEADKEKVSKKPAWRSVYQDSSQKAEDNKSSAYTLLAVGTLGIVAVILILAGKIPLYQNSVTARYLVCGVMGALFVLFIIFGITSMKSFKMLSEQAESENSLLAEMKKWCGENLNAKEIDAALSGIEDIAEEQKYFQRAEEMKRAIRTEFSNLEEAFLDHFVDDYYQNLF